VAKRQKRLEKLRQNPNNVRFEDLDQVLRDNGFKRRQPRSGSSHYVYVRGEHQLTVPFRRPFLRTIYIREALKLIDAAVESTNDDPEAAE
jgi:hypothetical protein